MFSRTAQYALRAMIFLARNTDQRPVSGPRIAVSAEIPRKYLSAILADLVRAGLLEGTRGKCGGFQMTQAAIMIRLADVVAPIEPINKDRKNCPFGNAMCSDSEPCAAHGQWKKVKAAATRFLEDTTLKTVAFKRSERGQSREKTRSTR